jgi:DNA polymerase-3 subunit delta'
MASNEQSEDPFAPRRNPQLLGHQAAEQRFLTSWRSGRVPHGWLITGPRGIGKATLAFRIARFVLANRQTNADEGPGLFGDEPTPAPDTLYIEPEDPVFRRVASSGHSDLITLEREFNPETNRMRSSIPVSRVRKAGDFMRLTPGEGGWRVVVVDSADELNANAANALLKVLEEPPDRAMLLLISHAPGRLLPTIRSRCCRIPLSPPADADVATIIATQRPDLSDSDRISLAALAEGSPGRALALADEDGLSLYRELISLMVDLPKISTAALHAFSDRLARRGAEESFRTASELLGWWIGRLARAGARGEAESLAPIVAEEAGCVPHLLAAAGVDRWLEVWEKINSLADQTDRLNLDRKQIVLNMFAAIQGAMRA